MHTTHCSDYDYDRWPGEYLSIRFCPCTRHCETHPQPPIARVLYYLKQIQKHLPRFEMAASAPGQHWVRQQALNKSAHSVITALLRVQLVDAGGGDGAAIVRRRVGCLIVVVMLLLLVVVVVFVVVSAAAIRAAAESGTATTRGSSVADAVAAAAGGDAAANAAAADDGAAVVVEVLRNDGRAVDLLNAAIIDPAERAAG